jgi:predicted HTH domain antitoxin
MTKKPLQVPLRDELVKLLDLSGGNIATRVEEAVVLELFQRNVISSRKAAELLGISCDNFRHMLAERQIPYFRQTIGEILHDRDVAARIKPD